MKEAFVFEDGTTVRDRLLALQTAGNKKFAEKLNPGVENVLGLRVPDLRKLAAEIVRRDYFLYLSDPGSFYMEERMLHGMVLGLIKVESIESYLEKLEVFVHRINSWSVCDTFSFSGRKKFIKENNAAVFAWLKGWLHSKAEYEVRFGVVILMQYYLDEDHFREVLQLYAGIEHKGYYVSMAVAWAISVAMVRYPEYTIAWLSTHPIDMISSRRAIQKSIESYRISPELKDRLRAMRSEFRQE